MTLSLFRYGRHSADLDPVSLNAFPTTPATGSWFGVFSIRVSHEALNIYCEVVVSSDCVGRFQLDFQVHFRCGMTTLKPFQDHPLRTLQCSLLGGAQPGDLRIKEETKPPWHCVPGKQREMVPGALVTWRDARGLFRTSSLHPSTETPERHAC